jgi:serine/threonine protein kinase
MISKYNQMGFHKNYKAIKKIGKGAFASVYLVESYSDGQKYAAKMFSKKMVYSEDNGKESLDLEIEVMKKLNH